jgi:hypothetical protein
VKGTFKDRQYPECIENQGNKEGNYRIPGMRRAFDGLLAILSPGIIIRWDISHLTTNCRNSNHPFNS